MITGGLGALGLEVAHFLVNQGARHLLLVGRRGAEGKEETVRKLEERGAQVTVLKADVSRADDVMRVLAAANSLRGIIHAAGVTTQESIAQMGLESLESVLRPKVAGAWLLHQMTERKEKALDFFVMFSSIASVWGSKGQAHYAAANAFLDALAHYRCSLGLPALAINWGPWADGGMAGTGQLEWLSQRGVRPLTPTLAIEALHFLLASDATQTTVAQVDWARFKPLYEFSSPRPLLAEISTHTKEGSSDQASLRQPVVDSPERLMTHLTEQVAQVMGIAPSPQQGFFEMGMDSLMAVELKNRLERSLGLSLSSTLAFNYPNLTALSEHLLSVMGLEKTEAPAETLVYEKKVEEPIAIIRMSCRVPGANDPEALWGL